MSTIKKIKIFAASFICMTLMLLLSGCCADPKKEGCSELPPHCEDLENLCGTVSKAGKIGSIRFKSLQDSALSMGARGGLAYRSCQIDRILLEHEKTLNRVFNFNLMLLDKNILPPVLVEARNTLQISGVDAIRIADRTYQIIRQAKFVTAPPTWRDYLWMSYAPPATPDKTLLPKAQAERLVWKKYIDEGWRCGIQQADTIFRENVARLKRDYDGMIRYRTLLAQCMVSPPYVAELDMGVTGGGSDLTINDRVLRITAFPQLQNDSSTWRAGVIPNENECE